ncbi:hypothetical protein JCM8097_008110 [Rhodosporidiobolus ruineniae]
MAQRQSLNGTRAKSPPARRTPTSPSSPPRPPHPQQHFRPSPHPQAHAHAQQHAPQPSPDDLAAFAALCHRLYFLKDPKAAREVDTTLNKLPASFRTAYARTMASVRAQFHREDEVRRRAAVEALLEQTVEGGTVKRGLEISPESTSVAALRSSRAKKLRRAGLKSFIDPNCVQEMPGTHPFFRSLFAALWLQGLEVGKGGAGGKCVEWEVDVAVFTEGGGGEGWAKEAVEALKGVLGMSERISHPSGTESTTTYRDSTVASSSRASGIHGPDAAPGAPAIRTISATTDEDGGAVDELGVLSGGGTARASTTKRPAPPVPPHRGSATSRTRSKSDPFLTPEEKAAKKALGVGSPSPPTSSAASPLLTSPDLSTAATSFGASASTPFLSSSSPSSSLTLPSSALPSPSPSSTPLPPLRPQHRTFTLPPYLTSPECRSLCRLFPDFVAKPARTKARFRSNSASKAARRVAEEERIRAAAAAAAAGGRELTPSQLEAGEGKSSSSSSSAASASSAVTGSKVGHGDLRVGAQDRAEGWRGTWWERFVAWWAGLFGR